MGFSHSCRGEASKTSHTQDPTCIDTHLDFKVLTLKAGDKSEKTKKVN